MIFVKSGELLKILKRVCFDQVFDIFQDQQSTQYEQLEVLVDQQQDEGKTLERVLDAHKNLAKLNKENESLYQDITSVLGG